jgi:hypothetical protein
MNDAIVAAITKTRKSLFHFTRAANLPSIASLDRLLSSSRINPHGAGERRLEPVEFSLQGYSAIINSHLRIAAGMMEDGTTQEEFRACLDRHVFFWPTIGDCRKMMDTYARREPHERFAVLELDARCLLVNHYSGVKLTKYDSGSSPRFPARCSYRKSLGMFLPLDQFQKTAGHPVPVKPSEIREVLVEQEVDHLSRCLKAVYAPSVEDVPDCWRSLLRPYEELKA